MQSPLLRRAAVTGCPFAFVVCNPGTLEIGCWRLCKIVVFSVEDFRLSAMSALRNLKVFGELSSSICALSTSRVVIRAFVDNFEREVLAFRGDKRIGLQMQQSGLEVARKTHGECLTVVN